MLVAAATLSVGRAFADSENVPAAVKQAESSLPYGWHLYEIGGQSLFSIYGMSGGISMRQVAYLVRDAGQAKIECLPVEFNDVAFMAVNYDPKAVQGIIRASIERAITTRKPRLVDPNTGELGLLTQEEREAENKFYSHVE